jgi:hypothetical protein
MVDFLGNIQKSPARGLANISIGKDILVSADIAIPKMTADSFRANFAQIDQFNLKGAGSAVIGIRGPVSGLAYNVSVAFPSLDLLGDQHLDDMNAEITYTGDTLKVNNARAKWRNAAISGSGNIGLENKRGPAALAFKGEVANLDISALDDLNPVVKEYKLDGTVSGNWNVTGNTQRPVVSMDIKAPRFSARGSGNDFSVTNVRANAGYEDGRINLPSAHFKLFGSDVAASGGITLASKERPLEYNVKGSFRDIDPSILASMGIISEDISGRLTGDARFWKEGNNSPSCRLYFKNSNVKYANRYDVTGINGILTYKNGDLSFDNFRSVLNMGTISLDGFIGNVMNWQKPSSVPLNIVASVSSADISHIARIFYPMSKGFQGLASGKAVINGNLAQPAFQSDFSLRGVRALGIFLPAAQFNNVKGDINGITFPDVSAVVGRGRIQANASIDIANGWNIYVKAEGNGVDIRSLTVPLENEMRREITGVLHFNFEGLGPPDSFVGKGKANIPSLNVLGMKISDASADFSVYDGFVVMEDSSANAYGGKLKAQLVKDLSLTDWGGQFNVTGADMAAFYKDFAPESEGSITGNANFAMRFSGDSRRTNMSDGSGKLEIFDGEVSGFSAAQSLSKLTGGKPVRFQSAHFTFSLDGKTVYIIPGSRISAPQEDTVFKYVMLDGNFTTDKNIDLSCVGNVNIRALNALTAGIQGVLASTFASGSIGDTQDLLQNFLGNTISGFSKNEFRDVSLKIHGHPGDIRFSDVKIASPVKMDTVPEALKNPDGYKNGDPERIQIKVEIPVGPGESHSSESVPGQVGGQLLDQILKGLIFD